jgi:hypothetical protein
MPRLKCVSTLASIKCQIVSFLYELTATIIHATNSLPIRSWALSARSVDNSLIYDGTRRRKASLRGLLDILRPDSGSGVRDRYHDLIAVANFGADAQNPWPIFDRHRIDGVCEGFANEVVDVEQRPDPVLLLQGRPNAFDHRFGAMAISGDLPEGNLRTAPLRAG